MMRSQTSTSANDNGQRQENVPYVPKLLVEQAWPEPVFLQETVTDAAIKVVHAQPGQGGESDVEQEVTLIVAGHGNTDKAGVRPDA